MNYHNITCPDMNNGDGLSKNCQNSQTWDPNSGILFDLEAENELFNDLFLDYISGITFSGGDPLYPTNRSEVLRLCKKIRKIFGDSKTIWLYSIK